MARLDAIGLTCADLERSTRFYRLLGLDVPESGGDHVDIDLGNGMRLMLDSAELVRKLDPEWTKPTDHAFGYDAFWGQRYATVLDPDGNAVDLYADLPR